VQDQYRQEPVVHFDSFGQHAPEGVPRFPCRPGHRPTGFIALGDSYSAGIGTGVNGTEDDCRHGLHAHPRLINQHLIESEGKNATTFQFLSCTGAGITDLLLNSEQSQIDAFNTTEKADFALLSIGGNDLGFFDIMNSCIFRFYSFVSGTCEQALLKSEEQLASRDFEHKLRLVIMEILDKVHWEKRPWFTITVTGYARFFNAETELCDESSFGIWWRGPKLKRELRRKMNAMVLAVNDKIRRSVDAVNSGFEKPKVFFVDYDAEFEGHRFCEPDIIEPDYLRNETWFFLVGGIDNGDDAAPRLPGITNGKLAKPPHLPVDPQHCMELAQASGDWEQFDDCVVAGAASWNMAPPTKPADQYRTTDMWYVPTFYGQTFHPVRSYPKTSA
jgi:hypothetical protein